MVQKKLPNCALRGKSTKLGTRIILDGLIILAMDPIQIHTGGKHNVPLVWPFCSIVHLYGENIRGKSTKFGMVMALTLPN